MSTGQGLYTTEYTALSKSTVGPVLVRSLGGTDDNTILEKAQSPSVHLLLATNNILRPHCAKFFGSVENLLLCLKEQVGVIPHSYQGKEGAFEGPQVSVSKF